MFPGLSIGPPAVEWDLYLQMTAQGVPGTELEGGRSMGQLSSKMLGLMAIGD